MGHFILVSVGFKKTVRRYLITQHNSICRIQLRSRFLEMTENTIRVSGNKATKYIRIPCLPVAIPYTRKYVTLGIHWWWCQLHAVESQREKHTNIIGTYILTAISQCGTEGLAWTSFVWEYTCIINLIISQSENNTRQHSPSLSQLKQFSSTASECQHWVVFPSS